jgi:hypothetical protein
VCVLYTVALKLGDYEILSGRTRRPASTRSGYRPCPISKELRAARQVSSLRRRSRALRSERRVLLRRYTVARLEPRLFWRSAVAESFSNKRVVARAGLAAILGAL